MMTSHPPLLLLCPQSIFSDCYKVHCSEPHIICFVYVLTVSATKSASLGQVVSFLSWGICTQHGSWHIEDASNFFFNLNFWLYLIKTKSGHDLDSSNTGDSCSHDYKGLFFKWHHIYFKTVC
jgi:hypothetical protein